MMMQMLKWYDVSSMEGLHGIQVKMCYAVSYASLSRLARVAATTD